RRLAALLVDEEIADFAIVAVTDRFQASTAITFPHITPWHHKVLVEQGQ
ncbi:unnamed protein product, partial [Microthlaspi erraticum]